MNDFDDLDSLLGPLREPATPAELACEREMVDIMTRTHRYAKGSTMFSSRRARVATLIAAGVFGFGSVAAASGGLDLPDGPLDVDQTPQEIEVQEIEVPEIEVQETTTTTAAPEVEESDDRAFTDEIAKIAPAVVAEDEAVDEIEDDVAIECEPGNHGATVSAAAHDELEGVEVRDAAHSDCGKTDDAADVDDVDEVDDESDDAAEVEDADEVDDESDDADEVEDDDADEDHGSTNRQEAPAGRESQGEGSNGGHGQSGHDD